ncbi:MAG: hypothetical protein IKL92_06745 [Oscillospiraceae bacterium]|nr:hypothetical protein [Oscillospiraceae bacterium]
MNNKAFARILALVLALVMMLSIVACNKTPAGTPSGTETTKAPEQGKDPVEDTRIYPTLPDKTYGGYEFRILAKGQTTNWWTVGIDAEERNGDPVNDATLIRNNKIEELFDITITEVNNTGVSNAVQQAVLTDADDFDLAVGNTNHLATLAPKYTVDWKTVPWVDLTKPWYDQNAVKELSIANQLFTVNGDLILNDENASWCVLYNPILQADYDAVPNDLYELVDNGTWTLDKMFEIASEVTHENSGDDKLDENDIWGFHTEAWNSYAMLIASGEKIASKDENDIPYLTANTEKFATVFEKAVKMQADESITFMNEKGHEVAGSMTAQIGGIWLFSKGATGTGCSLFRMAGVYTITQARRVAESDIDIGVLPMPKWDTDQTRYYTPITTNATTLFIPKNAPDLERTGAIIEALSAEARYTTREAFYEQTLKTKYSPEENSSRMLDLVSDSRTFDVGQVYGWGSMISKMTTMTKNGASNWASSYKSLQRVAERAIKNSIENFQKEAAGSEAK